MKQKRSLQGALLKKPDKFDTLILKGIRPYFWISLLCLIAYAQSIFFNFVYFDDNVLILDQQYFIKDISNIFKAFERDVFGGFSTIYYRPIYTISLILNGVIGGTNPLIYHITNLLLHMAVSFLLFHFLVKLKYEKFPALLIALIFSVLPVLTQTVVWIPGRNDLMLLLFILFSFIFFLDYIKTRKISYFILHSLFFCLAVFTKEIAVALPLILFFYLFVVKKEKLSLKEIILCLITWVAIFSLWIVLRSLVLKNPIKLTLMAIIKSVFSGLPAIIQYIGKIFLPLNLAVLPTIQDTVYWYGIIAIMLLITAIILVRKNRLRFVIFGMLWFFLFLLPSFISPVSDATVYYREDRLYIPVVGILLILLESAPVNTVLSRRKLAIPVFSSLLILFTAITIIHSTQFKDRIVFWESAVKESPHAPLAHRNLGAMYYFKGRKNEAEAEYRKALELNPAEPMAHSNLGAVYMDRNMLREAEAEFKAELQINPNFDRALYNLGFVNYKLQNFEEAIHYWKEAIQVNDMKLDAYYGLILAYQELKDEAKVQYYAEEYKKRGGKLN